MEVILIELLAGPEYTDWKEIQGFYIYSENKNGITVFLHHN